jgi:hypothetical protein
MRSRARIRRRRRLGKRIASGARLGPALAAGPERGGVEVRYREPLGGPGNPHREVIVEVEPAALHPHLPDMGRAAMLARTLHRAKAARERDVLIVGRGIEHREDRCFDGIDEGISVLDADKGVAAVM